MRDLGPMSMGRCVGDLMTREVVTLKRNDALSFADDLMRLARIRHMPVIDDDTGELVGVLSQRDLFRGALWRALGYGTRIHRRIVGTLCAKDVMASDLRTTTSSTLLMDAATQMLEHKIGCLPVVDDGELVGILTEADFVALIASGASGS